MLTGFCENRPGRLYGLGNLALPLDKAAMAIFSPGKDQAEAKDQTGEQGSECRHGKALKSQQVADQEHGGKPRAHKAGDRNQRAQRQARQSTDIMSAGAALTVTRFQAGQQAGGKACRMTRVKWRHRQFREQTINQRPTHQTQDERRAPGDVAFEGLEQFAQHADATLDRPTLMLPSIQVNVRAGQMPPADDNGIASLRIPLNTLPVQR